jgi:hypothetical protein
MSRKTDELAASVNFVPTQQYLAQQARAMNVGHSARIPSNVKRWPTNGLGRIHTLDRKLLRLSTHNAILDTKRKLVDEIAYDLCRQHFRQQELDYYPHVWSACFSERDIPIADALEIGLHVRHTRIDETNMTGFGSYDWTEDLRQSLGDEPGMFDVNYYATPRFTLAVKSGGIRAGILASRASFKEDQLLGMREVVIETFQKLITLSVVEAAPVCVAVAFIQQDPAKVVPVPEKVRYSTRQLAVASFAKIEWNGHNKLTAMPGTKANEPVGGVTTSVLESFRSAFEGHSAITPLRFPGLSEPSIRRTQLDRQGLINFLKALD